MHEVSTESGIVEWRPTATTHNFGDHLVWLIGERIFKPSIWRSLKQDPSNRYVLLGSFIGDYNLQLLLNEGYKPVLIGCGYRGDPLSLEVARQTIFHGCRGKFTQNALRELEIVTPVIGDPAMLLPLLISKAPALGKTVLIPHLWDGKRKELMAQDAGVNEVVQAETTDMESLVHLVRRISSASFVLAGAMHAAIIAHAYGVPFAFYRRPGEYLDCPPKWEDWLSSVSSTVIPLSFYDNLVGGAAWHSAYKRQMYRNRFMPILREYSKIGQLRLGLLTRAKLLDFKLLVTE